MAPYGYHHSFGAIFVSMWTCLVSWNASRPSWPELAPEARLLEAAERAGVVVGQRVVEPDRARLDLAHAAHDGLEVARVDVGAEPVARRVRQLDRLVERRAPARSARPGRRSPRAAGRSRAGAPVTTAGAKKWPRSLPAVVAAGHELGARGDRRLDLGARPSRAGAPRPSARCRCRRRAGRRARSELACSRRTRARSRRRRRAST